MKTLNDKDFNLIEDFISGNLSPEEEKKFRERLDAETNLAKAYRFRTKIAQYWNEAESYEITKSQVKELMKKERNRRKKFVTFLYAAASLVILIGISFFYFQQIKHGASYNKLTDIGKDTTSDTVSPLSTNTQPEKGTQYVIPIEYTINDTLIIKRTQNFKDSEKIRIECVTDNKVFREYVLETGINSLSVPLKGLQSGRYRWVIVGTIYSGDFIINKDPENKK